MKELIFLNKLKKQEKLMIIEPSKEIELSYTEKSDNSLKAAKLLFNNNLYENSISSSYYAMYNSLLALLFKVGIKSENHTGSIILLNKLFQDPELAKIILNAKEERIDKQYYVNASQDLKLSKESTKEMITKAEDFIIDIRLITNRIANQDINKIRAELSNI